VLPKSAAEVRVYEDAAGDRPFDRWFDRLDARAAARITRAVTKIEGGLLPDVKPVGAGVHETRIDFGPGYRVYFGFDGGALVILLAGGDKRTQDRDIAAAQARWADYKARKRRAGRR
jgi:putative addiction module killer protein